MSVSIAVVCEAPADKRTGCDLADRVICRHADWITPDVIESYRRYRGFEDHDEPLLWTRVRDVATRFRVRAHGWFDGTPRAPDALATRRALLVLKRSPAPPDAVILLRDSDHQPTRAQGMNQARDECRLQWQIPIVIGLARIMRECWVLVGYTPENTEEQSRLQTLRDGKQLGFDPTRKAERLTARTASAKKNSKRVLSYLTNDDREREARCWREVPLESLESHGEAVGLTAYLQEVAASIAPLFR